MVGMAKKKTAVPQRYGENLTVWVDPLVKRALAAFVEGHEPKTTLTWTVELALKEFLERRGQWPAK